MSVKYEWKTLKGGHRKFVRTVVPDEVEPAVVEAVEAADDTTVDYSAYSKAELVEAANAAGVDPIGTKATLIERLTNG